MPTEERDTRASRSALNQFWCEHQWEIIFGILFAVLAAIGWELLKLPIEEAAHVSPDRLASGTVRILIGAPIRGAASRAAVEEWRKTNFAAFSDEFAILNSGSAFVVSEDGFIVTAAHVIDTQPLAPLLAKMGTASMLEVVYPRGAALPANVVTRDDAMDVAILKVEKGPSDRFLVLGDGQDVRVLDRVFAIGYPGSADAFNPFEPTLTRGEISKVASAYGGTRFQTTAAINRGNSGGPLINEKGRVIGINVSVPQQRRSGDAEGISYARAIDGAKAMLEKKHVRLPSHYEHEGLLRQPWLQIALLTVASIALLFYLNALARPLLIRCFAREPRYAPLWARAAAFLIDASVTGTTVLFVTLLFIFATDRFMPSYALLLAVVPVWLLHQPIGAWRWGGGIGKRLAGLRVQRIDGAPLRPRDGIRRSLFASLSVILLLIGFLAGAFRRNRQTLHDRITGTVVVEDRVPAVWRLTAFAVVSCAVLFMALIGHLRLLTDRAGDDLNSSYAQLTQSGHAGASAARLLAIREDRMAWMRLFPTLRGRVSDELYRQGVAYMFNESPAKAIALFERYGREQNHSYERERAAAKIGWCQLDLGDSAAAKRSFDAALLLDRRSADALVGVAVAELRLGRRDSAGESYAKATRLDSGLATNPTVRAEAYAFTPGHLQAIESLRAAFPKE